MAASLDLERIWRTAWGRLRSDAGLLLPVAGLFVFVPGTALALLAPFDFAEGATVAQARDALIAYARSAGVWVILVALLAAFGNATMLAVVLHRDRPNIAEAMRRALPLAPGLLALDLVTTVVIAIGLFPLVAPGVYLIGRFSLASAAMVDARRLNPLWGVTASVLASTGNGWRLALLTVLIYLSGTLAGVLLGGLAGGVAVVVAGAAVTVPAGTFVSSAVGAVTGVLLLLVRATAWRQLAGASSGT